MTYHRPDRRLLSFYLRSKLFLSVCSLLLICLLAACSSAGSTATTSTPPGASTTAPTQQGNQSAPTNTTPISCSRISDTTVSQAIGIQLAPPTIASQFSTPVGNSTTCIYKDAATSQTQEVVINYYSGSSASQSFNGAVQKNVAPANQQSVSGLGDKAIFDTQEFALHVLKGNLYFYVSLVKLGEQGASKLLADARQIATAILAGS